MFRGLLGSGGAAPTPQSFCQAPTLVTVAHFQPEDSAGLAWDRLQVGGILPPLTPQGPHPPSIPPR